MPRGVYDRSKLKAREKALEAPAFVLGVTPALACAHCRWFQSHPTNIGLCNRYPSKISRKANEDACGEFKSS